MNRRCEKGCIGTFTSMHLFQTSNFTLRTSAQRLVIRVRALPLLARLGLTPRFGWHRLYWSRDYRYNTSLPDYSGWNGAWVYLFSCRCQLNWLPCHPGGLCSASLHSLFQFKLYKQTSDPEGVLQRAMFATVRYMRRRPSLPIRWARSCRRLFSVKAYSPSEYHQRMERFEPESKLGGPWRLAPPTHPAKPCDDIVSSPFIYFIPE